MVPEYYRAHIPDIAAFFRFESIAQVGFDQSVGEALRDQTILEIGRKDIDPKHYLATPADALNRSCVLHLSDLHFGSDYGFRTQGEVLQVGDPRATLTDCLIQDLDRIGMRDDIAAIVVTGDFISAGKWNDGVRKAALAEFDALCNALDIGRNQIIAAPGNHDIVRYPADYVVDVAELSVGRQANSQHEREFRTFIDELNDRNWKEPLNYVRRVRLDDVDLMICVLNSCTIVATEWTEYGHVGTNGLDAIKELGRETIERPTYKFLALHHHLLPVANRGGRDVRDSDSPSISGISAGFLSLFAVVGRHAGRA